MRAESPYRPDVDGLRAIAVAAVILFHAGVPEAAGGYVGVDVFFVISGFLITRWLDSRMAQPPGAMLREFYVRRARRILPALLLVMALAAIAALWLLQPAHLEAFGRIMAPAALMLGNFGAWRNGGYFGWNASDMPLLHLWSIGVEEQFYLLYPVLLLLISRLVPRWRRPLLAAGLVLSFSLCLWAARDHAPANYYLLPTRAWELLAGALVALGAWPRMRGRLARETAAMLALAVIVVTSWQYTKTYTYPGPLTLLPVLATAQLIATGEQGGSLAGRMLSWRPLVFTGLISYSLYLWHMPLFGLFRYWNIFELTAWQIAGLCVFLYLLSAASWKLVEIPFRRRKLLPRDRAFWYAAAATSLALFAVGVQMRYEFGTQRRLAGLARANPDVDVLVRQRAARCMDVDLAQIRRGELCRFGPRRGAQGRVLVWGDSHTWALVGLFKELAESERLQVNVAQYPACRPLIGAESRRECSEFNLAMVDAVKALDPGLIVLSAYWNNPKMPLHVDARHTDDPWPFSLALQETLRRVRAPGRQVCVIKTVPRLRYPGEYAMYMARRRGISADFLALPRASAYAQDRGFESVVDALQARGLLTSVDPKRVLCPDDRCRYRLEDGTPIYMDDNHVSLAGAELLRGEVAGCFAVAAEAQLARARSSGAR
ncbi:MAG TPA: acyltransferase family protein [Steroidobacteraceae bacterium]|nr:acyltransferase family protein [Steroidobacteraceae bacterium]